MIIHILSLRSTLYLTRKTTCSFSKSLINRNISRTFFEGVAFLNKCKINKLKLFTGKWQGVPCIWRVSHRLLNYGTLGTIGMSLCLTYGFTFAKCCNPSVDQIEFLKEPQSSESEFDWNKFYEFSKPDAILILISIVSAFIVAAINIKIPIMLGELLNTMARFTRDTSNEMQNIFNEMKSPIWKLIQLYVAQSVFSVAYISCLSVSGEHISNRLRHALFGSILKQDIAFFDQHKTGEILSRLTSDVQDFKSSFKLCISQGLRCITQATGGFVSLYLISPKMSWLMVAVLPTVILIGTCIGSVLRKLSKLAQAQVAKAADVADEAIGNIRTVRAFAMESKEMSLYEAETVKAQEMNILLGLGIGGFQGLTNLALNGVVLTVLGVGGFLLSTNEISPGSLMSFLVASQTIQRSLTQLSLLFGQYVRGMAAGSRIFQYINLEPESKNTGEIILDKTTLKGNIDFNNISFSYPTRPKQVVLENFNLTIPHGKTVALCGLSGGGKSTIASLLERFYECDKGSILLDGVDILSLDSHWLRSQVIGFINQEPILFATSIMENIRYGKPTASDQEVMEAARQANAHNFISSFPDGYTTQVGERGVTISGGQKQRIAIARALLKNPAILILDEATSALDAESEKIVQDALDKIVKSRTVLIIAHRLSTIQNADIIAVIANGRISEIGNHESLRRAKGLYWQLTRQQEQIN